MTQPSTQPPTPRAGDTGVDPAATTSPAGRSVNWRWSVGPDPRDGFAPLGTVKGAVSPAGASPGGGPASIDDDSTRGRLASRPATAVSPAVGSGSRAVGEGSSPGCWSGCWSGCCAAGSAADRATTRSLGRGRDRWVRPGVGRLGRGVATIGGVDDTGRSVAGELTSPTCLGAAVDPGLEPPSCRPLDRNGQRRHRGRWLDAGTAASGAGDGPTGAADRGLAGAERRRLAGSGLLDAGAAGAAGVRPTGGEWRGRFRRAGHDEGRRRGDLGCRRLTGRGSGHLRAAGLDEVGLGRPAVIMVGAVRRTGRILVALHRRGLRPEGGDPPLHGGCGRGRRPLGDAELVDTLVRDRAADRRGQPADDTGRTVRIDQVPQRGEEARVLVRGQGGAERGRRRDRRAVRDAALQRGEAGPGGRRRGRSGLERARRTEDPRSQAPGCRHPPQPSPTRWLRDPAPRAPAPKATAWSTLLRTDRFPLLSRLRCGS